jgi:hypothetical protein
LGCGGARTESAANFSQATVVKTLDFAQEKRAALEAWGPHVEAIV